VGVSTRGSTTLKNKREEGIKLVQRQKAVAIYNYEMRMYGEKVPLLHQTQYTILQLLQQNKTPHPFLQIVCYEMKIPWNLNMSLPVQ
jgi:hypothetical protein